MTVVVTGLCYSENRYQLLSIKACDCSYDWAMSLRTDISYCPLRPETVAVTGLCHSENGN